jgi:4-amino-4-deoxy-L-arabinose transferase-like glycosyltransferase
VTVDECADLPRGISILHDGEYRSDAGVTPLPAIVQALPVWLGTSVRVTPEFSAAENVWAAGRVFSLANADRYHRSFVIARHVSILMLLGCALLAAAFARSLYGEIAALVTLTVICFSPDMLAHGSLVTSDIFLAVAIVGSLWAWDTFLHEASGKTAIVLGAAVGLAALSKYTGGLLLVILPLTLGILLVLRKSGVCQREWPFTITRSTLLHGLVAVMTMVLVVNVCYGFKDTMSSLGAYQFRQPALRSLRDVLPAWTPVPLPADYLLGIDAQLGDPEDGYLLGRFGRSFWNFYLVCFLVKTPEPILLLALAATMLPRKLLAREVPLLVTGLCYLVFFSAMGHKNFGLRYLLFLVPLAAIWIARLTEPMGLDSGRFRRITLGGLILSLTCLAVTTLRAAPHYLAYFNAASGGPDNGHTYLLDSNLDWGQDILTLRDYMRREKIDTVALAYFGRADPAIYGVTYVPLIGEVGERYAVISANLLWGRMYFVTGTSFWPKRDYYAAFRKIRPKAILGHTLYVFDLAEAVPAAPSGE